MRLLSVWPHYLPAQESMQEIDLKQVTQKERGGLGIQTGFYNFIITLFASCCSNLAHRMECFLNHLDLSQVSIW